MMATRKAMPHPSKENDPFYDIVEDYPLIEASFAQQYGIRLSHELDTMQWGEFLTLLQGLNEFTPLGATVKVRSETDPKVIKEFNQSQRRVYTDWKMKRMKKMSKKDINDSYKALSNAFMSRQ